jgi:uncharacterized membrane protein
MKAITNPEPIREARSRSIIKSLTWRAIATSTTMALAYAATGDLKIAGAIGAADVVIKLFFYYIHERAWGRVHWGRNVNVGK